MRFRCSIAVLSMLLAAPARASGVDIAWDNCLGESGATSLKTFACDTNGGQETLWVSFESLVSATTMGRLEVAIQFQTRSGVALPAWWDFVDFASCRRGGLSADGAPPYEPPTCAPVATTTFVVDRLDYQLPTVDAGRMVVAANAVGPLVANRRYLACEFLLTHGGTSICAGCNEPVSITVTGVHVANVTLTNPITQNFALWQSLPTATRTSSWGALKQLYR